MPSAETLQRLMQKLGHEPVDLELFIIKCHLIVERELYWLLAHRLEIEERHLPPLSYFPLAKLSLGGEQYKMSVVKIFALNDLRNELGHELDAESLMNMYELFCKKVGIFWPTSDPLNDPGRIASLRESSVRLGAFSCIGEVWAHIARLSLDRKLYGTLEEEEHARRALAATVGQAELIRERQASAEAYWQTLAATK